MEAALLWAQPLENQILKQEQLEVKQEDAQLSEHT